jgi:putative exosortase-associated protein (TIGR04073 family)
MIHSGRALVGTCILASLLAHASFAGEARMGDPESTVKLASGKLLRGVVNTFTGVGEVVRQPIVCTMEDGGAGVPVGVINGFFMSFMRVGAGLIEVVTFPWALDETRNYFSLINPDYVWQRAN